MGLCLRQFCRNIEFWSICFSTFSRSNLIGSLFSFFALKAPPQVQWPHPAYLLVDRQSDGLSQHWCKAYSRTHCTSRFGCRLAGHHSRLAASSGFLDRLLYFMRPPLPRIFGTFVCGSKLPRQEWKVDCNHNWKTEDHLCPKSFQSSHQPCIPNLCHSRR